jgi:hypothetical protein
MIEILPAPDHVLALRMARTITGEDFDRMVRDVEAKLQRHQKIGVYVDMVDMEDMTAEALAKDLRYDIAKIGEMHRFPREAVVTDKQWVRAFAKVADALVPQVELHTFAPGERDQAMAWASQVNPS